MNGEFSINIPYVNTGVSGYTCLPNSGNISWDSMISVAPKTIITANSFVVTGVDGEKIDMIETMVSLKSKIIELEKVLDRLTKTLDPDPTHTTLEQRLTYIEDMIEFSVAANSFESKSAEQKSSDTLIPSQSHAELVD
jgi:hypothetical protein